MVSIVRDGKLFFPNILKTDEFQQKGFLYRQETGGAIGLHWVVIDPRKHKLEVWKKQTLNFDTAAVMQDATIVTNGPFFPI